MELLTVVAVMVILAGLLFPVLSGIRERIRRTVCISQLKQIVSAHGLYVQDHDEKLPDWYYPAADPTSGTVSLVYWHQFLQPYLRSGAVFHDPSSVWPGSPPTTYIVLTPYALLTWKQPGRRGDRAEPQMRWPGPPLTLAQIVDPARAIQIMDGWTTTTYVLGAVARHNQGMNAAFLDLHARWLSEKEFWRVDPQDAAGYYWLHYGAADR